jgi:hypothetical protein
MIMSVWSLFRKGQMQGAARTGPESALRRFMALQTPRSSRLAKQRTGPYARTGSTAATPQMAFPGQAPYGGSLTSTGAGASVKLLASRLSAT